MQLASALSIGRSGVEAFASQISTSAYNIANVQTQNFTPMRTRFEALPVGGVQSHEERTPGQGIRVDLASETVTTMLAREVESSKVSDGAAAV